MDRTYEGQVVEEMPRYDLPSFSALQAFEAAGRLGGIRKAALWLGRDHAVISRHIRSLEEWLGVPLVDREKGGAFLTLEGRQYHERVSAAFAHLVDATNELTRRHEQRLNVWCSPGIAAEWLSMRFAEYQSESHGVDMEMHPTDVPPDFTRFQVDCDIRYYTWAQLKETVSEMVRRQEVASPVIVAVASPAYVEQHGPIRRPSDLLQARLIHEESQDQWADWLRQHDVPLPDNLPGPKLWHAHVALEAARKGQGVALANRFLFGDDLVTGRLTMVATDCKPEPVVLGSYMLTARKDRWRAPAVVHFRNWLANAVAAVCQDDDQVSPSN
jgi:DNA-binding transcriptional LysR family regulator